MGGYTVALDGAHDVPGYAGSYCDGAGSQACTSGSPFRGDYTLDEFRKNLLYSPPSFHDTHLQEKFPVEEVSFVSAEDLKTFNGMEWTTWTR
jgi:hypothetical protein